MKVVMRSDIDGVGKKGDIVEVSKGYARNFLIPAGKALVVSDGVVAQAQAMKRSRELKDTKNLESAQTLAEALGGIVLVIPAKTGSSGKLFGSVGSQDIAEAIFEKLGATIDKKNVLLDEPIRSVGSHEVSIRLHSQIRVTVTVEVEAQQ